MICTRKNIILAVIMLVVGVSVGLFLSQSMGGVAVNGGRAEDLRLDDQEATILAIKKVIPAVVSIIVYDYTDFTVISSPPSGRREVKKIRSQKSRGTGFLISADGYILTNKHVAAAANEKTGEYRIILNSGKEYYAQLIGKDFVNDLAVLKIFDKNLPHIELGNSDRLQIGATVIAIGNALGRYSNSVTKGIVSGLGRSLVVNEFTGHPETLDNVIQTDAEINLGNSGGPLIDLRGRVVGINTAVERSGTAIGFAIPINDARPVINSIREKGYISRPRLGVMYRMITPEIARDNNLSRDTGAWIVDNDKVESVLPDSPAARAGLLPGDIIFEINAVKIEGSNTLLSVVQKYRPGDRIGLKIQRGEKVIIRVVELDEFHH